LLACSPARLLACSPARLLDSATFGRTAPKVRIRGTDFAGTVESVGEGVTRWRPGDDVFGESGAAIAEYVAAPEKVVATMPAGIGFEQAAAIPLAANTALVCLRAGQVEAGQCLLINGASGGSGHVRRPAGEVHWGAPDRCLQCP
jgi:NADPH:quinone reductase-like Zn-dependent oxidoreductase